jgi:hypothetical protein
MLSQDRRRRVLILAEIERRAKQFRSHDNSWPFRMPHEPLDFDAIVDHALGGDQGRAAHETLRARGILRMDWSSGDRWDLWALTLPSGVHLYCDADGHETRVLASARRGNPLEADGFFLERLAESHGRVFGIEMAGAPPDRVRSSIGDREFLADVFVELFESTEGERAIRARCPAAGARPAVHGAAGTDFRAVVVRWLDLVLSAPPMTRRQPRVRDEDPSAP